MADARWIGIDAFKADIRNMKRETDRQLKKEMRTISVAAGRAARRAAKVHRRTGQLGRSFKPRRGALKRAGYKAAYYSRANPKLAGIYAAAKAAAEAKMRADAPMLLRRIVGD